MKIRHVIVLACLLLGCKRKPPEDQQQAAPASEGVARQASASTHAFVRDAAKFEAELAALDQEIATAEARATAHQNDWLVLEKIANLWLRRARLSGSYDDYAKAEDALARAFARAAEGSGPLLTRASLNFTLHRLDAVDPDLDAVARRPVIDDPTRAVLESMRGDLAFARGQYELAKQYFDAAVELDRTPSTVAKLALWHWRAGEFDKAEARYRDAEALLTGEAREPRAWLHLQLGIMDLERGRYEDAFAHYRDGAAILGGWWLLEEHIAEILALLGETEAALALYDSIIARTGKGEFMDAKAGLLREAGEAEAAAKLVADATAVYEAELARFPEAAYGHALDHFLEFGPPARALELAEKNHALRPNVEAKLGLAEARLATGDVAGAKAIIVEALATPYVAAELFEVAARVYAAAGDDARAEDLRGRARALNPQIGE